MNPDQLPQPNLEMQPTSPPAPAAPQAQYSADYLNQIASTPQKKLVNKFAVFGLIFGFIALLFFVLLITNSGGLSVSSRIENVYLRLGTLQTVTNAQEQHLTENAINSSNASLSTSLISMNTDLAVIMKARGLKLPLLSSTKDPLVVAEKTYSANLSAKLDNAYLAGTLDRTYANEMAYQLTLLKSQLQQLKAAAHSASINSYYDTNVPTLDDFTSQLADFSASK